MFGNVNNKKRGVYTKRVIYINGKRAYECVHHDNYFITEDGQLYSIYIKGAHGKTNINAPRKLAYGSDKDGYYRVVLSLDGIKQYIKIHTLVVEQFIGDIPTGYVVNHRDGNKTNNSIHNLEIVTPQENTIHAHQNGLTSREIPVNVLYNNQCYYFSSLTDCMNAFPDLSRHYLMQLRKNEVTFSIVRFDKADPLNRRSKIISYYNGIIYKIFPSMQDADAFFGMKRGSTSSAIKFSEYRNKINQYYVTFPNVSTIENTPDGGSK